MNTLDPVVAKVAIEIEELCKKNNVFAQFSVASEDACESRIVTPDASFIKMEESEDGVIGLSLKDATSFTADLAATLNCFHVLGEVAGKTGLGILQFLEDIRDKLPKEEKPRTTQPPPIFFK